MEIKRKFAPYCCLCCVAIAAIIGFGTSSDSKTPVKAEKEPSTAVEVAEDTPNREAIVDDKITALYSRNEDSADDDILDDNNNASSNAVSNSTTSTPEAQLLDCELCEFPISYELDTDYDDQWFGTAEHWEDYDGEAEQPVEDIGPAIRYNEDTDEYETSDGNHWKADPEEIDSPIDDIGPAIQYNDETQEYETSDGNSWKE